MTELKQIHQYCSTREEFNQKKASFPEVALVFLEEEGKEVLWAHGKEYTFVPSNGGAGKFLAHDGTTPVWQESADIVAGLEEELNKKYLTLEQYDKEQAEMKEYVNETIANRDANDLLGYGVQWEPEQKDPVLTRVGNMAYHKTLPIQSRMAGCIFNPKEGKVVYWLNANDWRWKKEPTYLEDITLVEAEENFKITDEVFSTNQYKDQWVKVGEVPCQVIEIETESQTATIKPSTEGLSVEEPYKVELGAVRNGYDGEVMVYVPEFYIKSWDTDTLRKVLISPTKVDSTWTYQPETYFAAYHDTVLNTTVENMGYLSTLEANTAVSVANKETYCRGGNNSATYDEYLESDIFRTLLGKGRTSVSRANFRTYVRKADKEIMSYRQYKNVLYWLWVIEYANFNSQAAYNPELTAEGYHQGGMGNALTTMGNWGDYNGSNPITPNGYLDEIGNGTGIKSIDIPEFNIPVAQINDMSKWSINASLGSIADGALTIKAATSANQNVASSGFNNTSIKTTYHVEGLTGTDQTLSFVDGSNILQSVTEDGDVEIEWSSTVNTRYIRLSTIASGLNIKVTVVSAEAGTVTRAAQTLSAIKWRGLEDTFGNIWNNVDGIIIDSSSITAEDGTLWSEVYTTDNPEYYNDADFSNMEVSGLECNFGGGYTKEWDLGDSAEIIPRVSGVSGTSATTFKCDYHYLNASKGLRTLLLGGDATAGANAGLGYFRSYNGVGIAHAAIGFRSVFVIKH